MTRPNAPRPSRHRVALALVSSLAATTVLLPAEEPPDLEGRAALMDDIEIALDTGELDEARQLMAQFRERYPASSRVRGWENGNEVVYLYSTTHRLVDALAKRREFDGVLAAFDAELAGLTMEVPHYSWRFVAQAVPYLLETGRAAPAEIAERLGTFRDRFATQLAATTHPGRRNLFMGLITRMENALAQLELIGRPAPGFNFTQAFNAEPTLDLDALRGQVVLIDFWATWCAPCMEAWPSLAKLHRRFNPRGFEILSVTSLQGSVGEQKGLTPEREIEITEEFIRRHEVDWPVLFSDRSVNDPLYSASTLPTYVLVDRDGTVHRVLVGHFSGLGEAIIERMLEVDPGGA